MTAHLSRFGQNYNFMMSLTNTELAHFLQVNPSTVTNWVQGQKRPDVQSLVKLLAHFKGWFRAGWNPLDALDAFACLGYDWFTIQEVCARHFQKGGILKLSRPGGSVPGRPGGAAAKGVPPRPVIHVRRAVERDLVASLTTLSGYRQARSARLLGRYRHTPTPSSSRASCRPHSPRARWRASWRWPGPARRSTLTRSC